MLAGMSKEEKQILDLTTASDYVYLNQVFFFNEKKNWFCIKIDFSLMEQFIVIVEMMQKNGQQ